jgi:hypothetical protein
MVAVAGLLERGIGVAVVVVVVVLCASHVSVVVRAAATRGCCCGGARAAVGGGFVAVVDVIEPEALAVSKVAVTSDSSGCSLDCCCCASHVSGSWNRRSSTSRLACASCSDMMPPPHIRTSRLRRVLRAISTGVAILASLGLLELPLAISFALLDTLRW